MQVCVELAPLPVDLPRQGREGLRQVRQDPILLEDLHLRLSCGSEGSCSGMSGPSGSDSRDDNEARSLESACEKGGRHEFFGKKRSHVSACCCGDEGQVQVQVQAQASCTSCGFLDEGHQFHGALGHLMVKGNHA